MRRGSTHPCARLRNALIPASVLALVGMSLVAGCANSSESVGNTELNVLIPNNESSPGVPSPVYVQTVEYTINCLGNEATFLDNGASFPDEVTINGNLEVVDSRTSGSPPVPTEIWQGFMDLPPGPCTAQLRARDADGEVICTATEPFSITADATTKVNLILICDVSFQAPVGMLDVDATFSFNVGNFCPDLFVLNCLDSNPVEQDIGIGILVAATTCEVRFRDGDGTCGQSCDPQTCTPAPGGLDCAPGPDLGVSTTVTCSAGAQIDCDGNPSTTETECIFSGDQLGSLAVGAPNQAAFNVACIPPALGGPPGIIVECTAVTTDGDADCDKVKVVTITCPGTPPCDPSVIDCEDGNDCTVDGCDDSTGVGVCTHDPAPAGAACIDAAVCTSSPGACDGAGICAYDSCAIDGDCNDGNECTTGVCDIACGVCGPSIPVSDGASCDAGLGPGSGACLAGACAPICGTTTCPDNGVPCVTDVCNPVDGSCEPTVDADGSVCDPPGGTAGAGSCDAGVCAPPAFAGFCQMPLVFEEPLCNATYDDTLWPGAHRGSYAQGSAAAPGPGAGAVVTPEHIELPGAPIITSFTEPYPDGGRAAWSSVIGASAAIVKLDHDTFQLIDDYIPSIEETNPPIIPVGLSGAYTAVDSEGNFIVGRTNFVSTFGDSVPGDRFSAIALKRRVFLGSPLLCNGPDGADSIAGMSLTFDGHIAFATERGNVFVIPVDAQQSDIGPATPVISTNPDCATANAADLELVSNSIATDENGGIYVVTSAAMYRFDWNGASLTQAWRVPYDSDPDVSPIRLGPGSGQTPSLMGTEADDDRLVVIGDGKQLMNLLFMWRDDIPPGWTPIAPGKDPRIACEVPINFGDPSATAAISEQSIAVRGYGAIVVNNLLTNPTVVPPSSPQPAVEQNLVSALEGGLPAKAPVGIERVDWNPVTQTCSTVWTNSAVSIPNGIPSISEQSRLVYGIGQRAGQFGVEGLDLDTGASLFWAPGGSGACDPGLISIARVLPTVDAILDTEVIPGSGVTLDQTSCENSVYAATTVGPDGSIYTGTFFGMSKYSPDFVPAPSQSVRAHAGVEQALDLLARAQAAVSLGDVGASEDFVGRAYRQVIATVFPAQITGPATAHDEVVNAAASVNAAFNSIHAAVDPTPDINQAIVSLNAAASLLN